MEVKPVLVFDLSPLSQALPKNFRMFDGFSASGQFSESMLRLIQKKIPNKQLIIVDLRQESHGFINGQPVSWYVPYNNLNAGMKRSNIEVLERTFVNELSNFASVDVADIIHKHEGHIKTNQPKSLVIERAETENELVARLGLKYQRMYILDHHRPEDKEVDIFVEFVRNLPANHWLHFHCRAGRGRSSTFTMMYEIIKRANQHSLLQIMTAQVKKGGKDLFLLPVAEDKLWKTNFFKSRREFIESFDAYVRDPQGYAVCSWSTWLKVKGHKTRGAAL